MQSKVERLIPLALAATAFVIVTGGWVLDPTNIAWLEHGDTQQHYLGWAFYRQSPWSFPVGLNPAFGLELSNSIVFSDSIPLLAVPIKLVSGLLPQVFQYFGPWLLLCFVLQAVLAWAICGRITQDRLARAAMTGFFVFAPPMLWRLHGHLALFAHFLILAGFYLTVASREGRRRAAFVALVGLAAAVHAYLLAMVAGIWLASLLDDVWRRRRLLAADLAEFVSALALTALVCWQAGYFAVRGGLASEGYGLLRFNLLSPIDPNGWSRLIDDVPGGSGDYEGFNYLGLGLLLIAVACLPHARSIVAGLRRAARDMPFAVLLAIALTAFAATNHVGFAGATLSMPLPDILERPANVFRASGRMFWPVYYLGVVTLLLVAVRSLGVRRARWFFTFALAVQIYDTSAGWTFRETQLTLPPSRTWPSALQDPFWAQAAERYREVRHLVPTNRSVHWSTIGYYAATRGLPTDAVYLARVGEAELSGLRARAQTMLASGRFDTDAFYVLDEDSAQDALRVLSPDDMLATIDGLTVLAPGWRRCADCVQPEAADPLRFGGAMTTGRLIELTPREDANYLGSGWGEREDGGVWSSGAASRLRFAAPLPARFRLTIVAHAFGPNVGRDFGFRAGEATATAVLGAEPREVSVDMEPGAGATSIGIVVPQPTSPRALGINEDGRNLGIQLKSFRIDPLP